MKKMIKPVLLLSLLLAAMLLMQGCVVVNFGPGLMRGNGQIETGEYNLGSFSGVRIGGGVEFIYVKGDTYDVTLRTDSNILEITDIQLEGDVLAINFQKQTSPTVSVLTITAPTLSSIRCSGAAEFSGADTITADRLELDIMGACDGKLNVEAKTIRGNISGAARLSLAGTCDDFRLDIAGAGDVDARDMIAKVAEVEISGVGNLSITCTDTLEATINGAGAITYYGEPSVNSRVNGPGSIRKG